MKRKQIFLFCLVGAIFVGIFGALSHFFYEWSGENKIVGIFFPVNESTWEHLKLAIFPTIVYFAAGVFFVKNENYFVSFFVALYGIIQTIASLFGKILTTYIPLLPIMGTNNLDDEIRLRASYGLAFRCQSILNEPAALCCYLILPIILCLFVERQNNRKNQKINFTI